METAEYYSGEGSFFGYGTNDAKRTPSAEVLKRIQIVEYLTATRGRKLNAIELGHLESVSSKSYKLTKAGWDYWKTLEIQEK